MCSGTGMFECSGFRAGGDTNGVVKTRLNGANQPPLANFRWALDFNTENNFWERDGCFYFRTTFKTKQTCQISLKE